MSGHRRVKNVDCDDDDDDDYDDYDEYEDGEGDYATKEGEEAITDEDKLQLQEGTVKVRQALVDSAHLSDKAIQDSLWHYWFDVDKTVVYLKNQHRPKQQEKQAKAKSKFDEAAGAAAAKLPVPATNGLPWTTPEPSQNTTFEPVERRPRLFLLGGSGKPSKLAALAAARKARGGEKRENTNPSGEDAAAKTSNALSLLDRLGSQGTKSLTSAQVGAPQSISKQRRALRIVQNPEVPSVPQQSTAQETKHGDIRTEQPGSVGLPKLESEPTIFAASLCSRRTPPLLLFDHSEWAGRLSSALLSSRALPTADFSDLSPDARVFQAQEKVKKHDPKAATVPTKAVQDLKISSPATAAAPQVRVKSKNLNVVQEYERAQAKRELSFVVVGHIDHGKSTLMGRLLFEHKIIDQRSLDKYKKEAAKIGKESFALAWIMDARDDEREHGVTMDYAEKTFDTEKTSFTVIDAPGHRDFVGNMIAGATMADFALLVVDAGANSFAAGLKGQTREHAQILRCLKLGRLIVAINKMDSVSWSEEAFENIKHQTTAFLQDTLFLPSDITFVPVSGLTGDNVLRPTSNPKAKWYAGPTLTQALDDIRPQSQQLLGRPSDPFRLRIATFTGLSEWAEFLGPAGANEVFTAFGRVEAGNVQVGDRVVSLPTGEKAVVRGITKHGAAVDWAVAGQIIGLQLVDCDEERFNKGDLLCDPLKPAKVGALLTVKVLAFDAVFPMPIDVHRGRMRVPGHVQELGASLDAKSGEILKEGPKTIKKGEVARVKIELDELAAIDFGTRVVLRSAGETVAAGAVERVEQF